MKWLLWGLFGLCAAAVFGIALAPARAFLAAAPPFVDVRGPWWRGDAGVSRDGERVGRFSWTLDPLALFAAQAAAHWRFDGAGRGLAGRVARGFDDFNLDAAGEVAAATVNRVASGYGIALAGTFTISELRFRNDAGSVSANGQLRWSGGATTYALGGHTRAVDLPAMTATLASQGDAAVLEVRSAAADLPLLDARLQADGWLRIRLTKRFLALAGNPWPGTAAPDDFVFAVAERCFAPPAEPLGQGLAALLESRFTC